MSFGLVHKTAAAALVIAAWSGPLARAQFVPGRIFTVDFESHHCKANLDNEYVLELDPDRGTTRVFAEFNNCPGLRSMAMSPDGKHLRVAALHWGAILEFNAQGDWEVVINGSDGILPEAIANCITYDREGNFYASGRGNVKVMKFPADGGPSEPLAYFDNNGVIMDDAYGLSVSPDGDVYVVGGNKLFRIGEDGEVALFDTFGPQAFINSVLVDDFGYLHVNGGGIWYSYVLGDPGSREVFSQCINGQGVCNSYSLVLSPDRFTIYTQGYDTSMFIGIIQSVDPNDGSIQEVMRGNVSDEGLAVVPIRGDIDGDGETNLNDLEWFTACMTGPEGQVDSACDLADMDADGDVELIDYRYFLKAYAVFLD